MSTVREHLGLLWLLRHQLKTSNPQYDKHWAMQAALFSETHLDELIALAGGADVEGWVHKQGYEVPADFPYHSPTSTPAAQVVGTADIELLSLAAKAAGLDGHTWCEGAGCMQRLDLGTWHLSWNPLTDDGDALRLAVKLELDIAFMHCDTLVLNVSEGGGDPFVRTRRAIVRAAAEIGRGMS